MTSVARDNRFLSRSTRVRQVVSVLSFCCLISLFFTLMSQAQDGQQIFHHTVVFPGLGDDGFGPKDTGPGQKGLVPFTQAFINPEAQVTITIKPNGTAWWNYPPHGPASQRSIRGEEDIRNLLSELKQAGVHNAIINVDMKLGFFDFLFRGAGQRGWASSQAKLWVKGLRDTFENCTIGLASHSHGNAPAAQCIEDGLKIDYAVMASPAAKRDSLNELAKRTRLLCVTADGDFHGPVSYDGPAAFSHVKLLDQRHDDPHNSLLSTGVFGSPDTRFETNMPRSGEARSAGTLLQSFVREASPRLTVTPEPGGVDIAVKPKGQKKDLQSEKDRILQSRPNQDQLSWPQKPKEDK